jgi:LuxR family maltose regulon positive regulatory protein
LWRGQGLLREITADDLSFTRAETWEAIRAFGADDSFLDDVFSTTQGWPAGVLLLSQRGGSARSMSHVHEFIEAEVLEPLPPDLRSFLCDTAVLGTVTADLAVEITGEHTAVELLERHFDSVLIHDVGLETYHFHPLLEDCARSIYARQDPQRLQNITSRAATWHLERGHLELAVHLALTSGDWQTMGQVIWPAARLSLLQGRTATVLGWLDVAGERAVHAVPELSLTAAFAHLATGHLGHVMRYTRMTSATVPNDWRTDVGADDVRSHLALLIAITHFGLDDLNEAVDLSRSAVAAFDPDNPIQALGHLALALNLALIGDPQADEEFHVAAAISRAVGLASTEAESHCLHGLWQVAMGSDTAACENLESALTTYAFHDLKTMASTSGVIALGRVALAAVRGNERDVAEAITQQLSIDPELGVILPWYRPMSGAILALASIRRGDLDGYREYVSWCEDSNAPAAGMCTLLTARAHRGYSSASPLAELSPAERRVWDLLMGRMTLAEIGRTLFLSRETVKSHTAAIYRKLNVQSRRQAQELAETWH